MNKLEIIDAEKLTYEVMVEDDLHNWDILSPYEIATIIRKLLNRIDELENHIYYKNCIACGKEFKSKRKDAKYCVYCSKSVANRAYYLSLTEGQKQKRREQAKMCMRRIRAERKEVEKDVKD